MTKPDKAEAGSALDAARGTGGLRSAARTGKAFARSIAGRAVMPVRAVLATLGPLGAALWALYPVTIVLLIVGFLFAGACST